MSQHVPPMNEKTPGDQPRGESERESAPPTSRAAGRRPPPGQVGGSAPATTAAVAVAPAGAIQRHTQKPPAAFGACRATQADHRQPGQWISVERAATFLGVQAVTLRRALERGARRRADGSVIAQADGVVARKLGRVWRVWLDAQWRNPTAAE